MFVARNNGAAGSSAAATQAGSFDQHVQDVASTASSSASPEGALFKIVAGYDRGRLNEVRETIREKGLSFHPSRHRLVLDPVFDVTSVPVEQIATNLTYLKKREKEKRGHAVQPVVMVYTARIPDDLEKFLKEKKVFYKKEALSYGLYTVPYKKTHTVTRRIPAQDLLSEDIYSTRLGSDGNYYTDQKIVSHTRNESDEGNLFTGEFSTISGDLWSKPKQVYKRIKTGKDVQTQTDEHDAAQRSAPMPIMTDSATQTDIVRSNGGFISIQPEKRPDMFPSLAAEAAAEDVAWAQIDSDTAALPVDFRPVSPSAFLEDILPVASDDSAYQSAFHSPDAVEGMFGLDEAMLTQWFDAHTAAGHPNGSL